MSGDEQPSRPRQGPEPAAPEGAQADAPEPEAPETDAPEAAPSTVPQDVPSTAPEDARPTDWRHLARRAAIWVGLGAAVVVLAMLLASFVPRWWSEQVGSLVEGTFALGVWWGLFFGAAFTILPLIVAWQATRPGLSWQMRVGLGVLALVLATPNLLTLSVVLGTNDAARAGERVFDVQAPAFRGATGWGAVIGFVLTLAFVVLWAEYRRRGRKLKEIEEARRSGGSRRKP